MLRVEALAARCTLDAQPRGRAVLSSPWFGPGYSQVQGKGKAPSQATELMKRWPAASAKRTRNRTS